MTNTDELEIAEPDDFFVKRDEDDELQPVTQKLPGVEQAINVIPLSMGDVNKYGGTDGGLNPSTLSNEDIAAVFNNHWYEVRENEDYEITPEMVAEDMIGFGKDALLTAILRASGYDMQNQLNLENLEMLEQIDDPGKLETMMELAEQRS